MSFAAHDRLRSDPSDAPCSVQAFVALGSNLGNREALLERALVWLGEAPRTRLVARSPWVETEPVGGPPGQGRFLNGAARLETGLTPRELLAVLLEIEALSGRVRTVIDGPRTLDLDLLLCGDARSDTAELVLPHPGLEERAFVLEPLAYVAPELVLPGCGLTVRARLAELGAARVS